MRELFEKNLQFFRNNSKPHYDLIQKHINKAYEISQNNIFLNKKPLYPDGIISDSLKIASNPLNNPLWEREYFYLEPVKWEEKDFYITGKIVNFLINEAEKMPSYTKKGFYFDKTFLPSTVLYGLAGGKHLDILVKNYEFQSLFVYEPNPEFFVLSLNYVDYPYIYEKLGERFFLWVNGKVDFKAIKKFYYERIVTSSFFTLSYTMYDHPLIQDAKSKFAQTKITKLRGWGTYEDEIKGIKNHFKNITKYPLLQKSKKLNVPFCVIANGKSLEKSIDFLKKNKDSMILVSVGTAIKPLLKAGIQSDFHIEQERIEILYDALKDALSDYKGRFVGASVVNPKVFSLAKDPFMFVREGFTFANFYPFLIGSSPLVGNSGLAFAANFTNEIYLVGMDLGFRLNQKKHAKGSFYDDKNDIEKNGVKIEGNFSNDIYTNSLFLSSKENIEKLIKYKNLKVYNLSDGVKINFATPLKDVSLPTINKSQILNEIVACFEKTEKKEPELNLNPIINAFVKSLNLEPVSSKKELTGRIDFTEEAIKILEIKNPALGSLLRGSFYHILLNIYILGHKLHEKDLKKVLKKTKKLFFEYEKHFNLITNNVS